MKGHGGGRVWEGKGEGKGTGKEEKKSGEVLRQEAGGWGNGSG